MTGRGWIEVFLDLAAVDDELEALSQAERAKVLALLDGHRQIRCRAPEPPPPTEAR